MNPIQFTSRDFESILADINADPNLVDKPDWFKRIWAGIGDVLSVWENASANQAFLRTAFTRKAVADILALINYQMTPMVPSSGTMLFDMSPTTIFPATFSAADIAANTVATSRVASLRFESRTSVTVAAVPTDTVAYTAWDTSTGKMTTATSTPYVTGEKVRFTTTGALPSGIAINTDYYAIYVDATHVQFATSRANAFAGIALSITTQGSGNDTVNRYSFSASCYQQTSQPQQNVGSSDGSTTWQTFQIAQVGVIKDTVVVTINGVNWTVIDYGSFVNYTGSDQVVMLGYNTDGTAFLEFGDGTYGAIPPAFPILVTYAYGGGQGSNVSGLNTITVYVGSDPAILGCTNPTAFTGGADAESLDLAKQLGPLTLAAQGRFVTPTDGQTLALDYGGLSLVKVNPNVYGVLSCQVVGVANGGGNPSSALKSALQTYLVSVSILSDINVSVEDATITAKAVTATVHLLQGYQWATVLPYLQLACQLFFAETGQEILSAYTTGGAAQAVPIINTYLGTSFGAGDYTAIQRLLDVWKNGIVQPRGFGDTIEASDFYTFLTAGIAGVDYIVATLPAFPYVCAANEITTKGTPTLTQV